MTALHIADALVEAISIERGDTTLANVKAELAATFARMTVIESSVLPVETPECACQQFDNGSR
jgi:hypothetical protein